MTTNTHGTQTRQEIPAQQATVWRRNHPRCALIALRQAWHALRSRSRRDVATLLSDPIYFGPF